MIAAERRLTEARESVEQELRARSAAEQTLEQERTEAERRIGAAAMDAKEELRQRIEVERDRERARAEVERHVSELAEVRRRASAEATRANREQRLRTAIEERLTELATGVRRQAAQPAPIEAIDEPERASPLGSEAPTKHELGPAGEPDLETAEEPPAAAPSAAQPGTAAAASVEPEPEPGAAAGASVEPHPALAAEPGEAESAVEPETAVAPVEPDAERGITSARFADPAASHDTASPLAHRDGVASRPAGPHGEETATARALAQSRRHLEARTDEQLAQTYEETRRAVELAQQQNDGATAEHFSAINRATVQEAARRPDFGVEVHERGARMWFRRGRRSRAFDELEAARRELLEDGGE